MAGLLANDYVRQTFAGVVAAVLAAAVLWPVLVEIVQEAAQRQGAVGWATTAAEQLPLVYLVLWVSYAAVYCFYTHLVYTSFSAAELHHLSREQYRAPRRWWHSFVGSTSPETWTMMAAGIAAGLTAWIATTGQLRGSVLMIVTGFAAVAGSWAIMVYSYSLKYTRIRGSGQSMVFPVEDEPVFSDFLTHAVFVSTLMGGHAQLATREAWTAQRSHALLAFAFNTVIVAMSVTLLFGGFTE